VRIRISPEGVVAHPETTSRDPSGGKRYRAQGYFRSGSQDYGSDLITKEEIIKNFMNDYTMHLDALERQRQLPR
jgi:hypothetical protein